MYRGIFSIALLRISGCTCLLLIAFAALYRYGHRSGPYNQHKLHAVDLCIFNATLGFERIFVLNVPSRTDKADWVRLSAAASELQVDFLDGINGDDVLDKALPYPPHRDLGKGNIGSWRAHMNAMAYIVSSNLTSALILEDDADWDIRIKQQMRTFAQGSRALSQPILGSHHKYIDPTFLNERPKTSQPKTARLDDDDHFDITAANTPPTIPPRLSPYGDDWDVLWLGHCGMRFPRAQDHIPKGRYIISSDETVIPESKLTSADPTVLPQGYPAHTRIVHHAWDPVCTYAYGVSQRGARKLLYEFGIKRFDVAFDNLLARFCDTNVCLGVQPQLFSAFAAPGPVNRDSEINGFGQAESLAVRERGWSENLQKSVRWNMQAILEGTPLAELEDQFPSD